MSNEEFSGAYQQIARTAAHLRNDSLNAVRSLLADNIHFEAGSKLDVLVFNQPIDIEHDTLPFIHGLLLDKDSVFVICWNPHYPLTMGAKAYTKTDGSHDGNGMALFNVGLHVQLQIMQWLEVRSEPKWFMACKHDADVFMKSNG